MSTIDSSAQTNSEVLKSPALKAVDRVKQIYATGQAYDRKLSEITAQNKILQEKNLDPEPIPPQPEEYPLFKLLSEQEANYNNQVRPLLSTIQRGADPRNSLGMPFNQEEAESKVQQAKDDVSSLIDKVGEYDDPETKDLVAVVRAKALLAAAWDRYDGNPEIRTQIIKNYPESLSFFSNNCAEMIDRFEYSSIENLIPDDKFVAEVLRNVALGNASLSPELMAKAEFFWYETKGRELFQTVHGKRDKIEIPVLQKLCSLNNLPANLGPQSMDQGSWTMICRLAEHAGKMYDQGDSSPDTVRLQAVLVGYVKGLMASANPNIKNGEAKGKDPAELYNNAYALMTYLVGEKTTMLDCNHKDQSKRRPLFQTELSRVHLNERNLSGNYRGVGANLYEHDQKIKNIRYQAEVEENKKNRQAEQEQAEQAKAAQEAAKAAVLAESIRVFRSEQVQGILDRFNLSDAFSSANQAFQEVNRLVTSGEITKDQGNFASEVVREIYNFSKPDQGILVRSTTTVVDKKGLFGFGKHTREEPVYFSNYKEIDQKLDTLNAKGKLTQEEESQKLALEYYRRMSDSGQQ